MAQALIDHDRIREWAEARGGTPASVRGTGSAKDPGLLRIDMPGGAGNESLQRISWDDWFRKFEAQQLALLIDDDERPSTFNKLVYRREVNIDINPASRRRGAGSKESNMAKSPSQTPRSRGVATPAEDQDTQRDDERTVAEEVVDEAVEVDELDDDTDENDDEFEDAEGDDDADTDDDIDADDDLDEGEDEGDEDEDESDEDKKPGR